MNVICALSPIIQLLYPKYASQAILQILQQASDISAALISAYPLHSARLPAAPLSASLGFKQCSTAYIEQWPHDRAQETPFRSIGRFAAAHPEHS